MTRPLAGLRVAMRLPSLLAAIDAGLELAATLDAVLSDRMPGHHSCDARGASVRSASGALLGVVRRDGADRLRLDHGPDAGPTAMGVSLTCPVGTAAAPADLTRSATTVLLDVRCALTRLPRNGTPPGSVRLGADPTPWATALAATLVRTRGPDGLPPLRISIGTPWTPTRIWPSDPTDAPALALFDAAAPAFASASESAAGGRPTLRIAATAPRTDDPDDGCDPGADPLATMRALAMAIAAGALPRA